MLVRAGCDINARNKRRQTALHIAVNRGHIWVVRTLLKLACHVSLQDLEGDTPLHDTILKKRDDMLEMLLDGGADVTVTNNNGFNVLHHAALRGNPSAMCLILNKLKRPWVIDEKKDDGYTALHLAALNNHLQVAETLIKMGHANLDIQNINHQTPLHLAVERQNIQIVRLLVSEGAKVNLTDRDGDTPLHEALRRHTVWQIKTLQEKKDLSVDKVLMNITAHGRGHISASIAHFLAAHSADLNLKNKDGFSPLHLCPDPNLCKILVKAGNESNIETSKNDVVDDVTDHISPSTSFQLVADCESDDVTNCDVSSLMNNLVMTSSSTNSDMMVRSGKKQNNSSVMTSSSEKNESRNLLVDHVVATECLVCCENEASVTFKPCGHICVCKTCSNVIKKCLQCREVIYQKEINSSTRSKPQSNLMTMTQNHFENREEKNCAASTSNRSSNEDVISNNFLRKDTCNSDAEIQKLQQQLQDIKQQVMCPVCLDKIRNMIFLCGHGTCQLCGDQMNECPICRKTVQKRILLY